MLRWTGWPACSDAGSSLQAAARASRAAPAQVKHKQAANQDSTPVPCLRRGSLQQREQPRWHDLLPM